MVTRYIKDKTTNFYKQSTGSDKDYILIYGDELDLTGIESNNRVEAIVRDRTGWVRKDEVGEEPVLEVYFIDVGQGDSTFIVTPNRKKILIDGGQNNQAIRFLSWKYKLGERAADDPLVIDLLVSTHPDSDHLDGLFHFLSYYKIKVKEIVHSGIALYKTTTHDCKLGNKTTIGNETYLASYHSSLDELDDNDISTKFKKWKDLILDKGGVNYHSVHSRSPKIDIGDSAIKLEVLGPKISADEGENPVLKWFGSASKTVNGNSVVLKLTYDRTSFLFGGDLNEVGSLYLYEDNDLRPRFDSHVFKAPHHGSHDYSVYWLQAVNPQISIISSGDEPDHGHPRANFLGIIGNVSRSVEPLMFSTEIASTFEDISDNLEEEFDLTHEVLKNFTDENAKKTRRLYKKRLHGMINIRSNGNTLFGARRVMAYYHWETYWKIQPASRNIF